MEKNNNMLPIGTLLRGGTYRITRQLKSGGFGNTYVVENVHFDEIYAMKEFFMQGVTTRKGTTVSVSLQDNAKVYDEQKEKFKKEAQRIRKLNHPNIVKIYDLFEDNGTYYYVMDYIDGESLSDRLSAHGLMSESEAIDVLKKVLDALQVVHSAGFTHMDITPRNIMQDSRGNVFLIDFGASKQIAVTDQKTLSHTAMTYSKGYAPTEQVEKEFGKIGPWTDFYALGATLYRLLTLESPPSSSEIISYVYTHGADPFSFPQSVSPSTQTLIRWLMNPAIDERPQTVNDIRSRLENDASKEASVEGSTNGEAVYDDNAVLTDDIVGRPVSSYREETVYDYSASSRGRYYESVIDRLISNMVRVEGGTFTMGATSEQGSDAYSDEKPAHQVTLSSFSIGKYEVTQEEWQAVMGSNPSNFKGAKRPVESVSWEDCQEFIRKLNALTGKQFRLPTEAEWEYAARGGNRSQGYKYAGSDNLGSVAWFIANSSSQTHDVGQKSPNELGLYDMSGNVWEWCQDWYGSYSSSSQTNPAGPSSGSSHVLRGGSWDYYGRCRSSDRGGDSPSYRDLNLGLRLAL